MNSLFTSRWCVWPSALSVSTAEALFLVSRLEDLKAAHKRIIDRHHRSRVVKLAAVVWRTKQCDELPSLEELVPIFDNLMRSADEINVVLAVELADDVLAEGKTNTSVVITKLFHAALGVRP